MNAIRSFQAGSSLSCAMRIATVFLVAVAAGCGGSYSSGSGSGGMAASARPTITTQPMSQTVTAPTPATFTVAASGASGGYGTGGFTYQWMTMNGMNASPIMGATMSSYTTPATTTGETATFFVAVTNSYGTTDSNMVTLTVN